MNLLQKFTALLRGSKGEIERGVTVVFADLREPILHLPALHADFDQLRANAYAFLVAYPGANEALQRARAAQEKLARTLDPADLDEMRAAVRELVVEERLVQLNAIWTHTPLETFPVAAWRARHPEGTAELMDLAQRASELAHAEAERVAPLEAERLAAMALAIEDAGMDAREVDAERDSQLLKRWRALARDLRSYAAALDDARQAERFAAGLERIARTFGPIIEAFRTENQNSAEQSAA